MRWLGAAGFALELDGFVLLLDPYLTRRSLWACLARPLEPDLPLLERLLPRADAIVLGHTHFDHALDTPALARRTGARVFGSRSAAALCRAAGVPAAQVVDVESDAAAREAEVGPFRLRFFPSAHSRLLLGRVPFAGEIDDCDALPVRAERYRCGAVFAVEIEAAGRRVLHLGSAELVEASLPPREVDLLLLCVAGWTKTPRLPERALRQASPGAVLLSHWDDFLRPVEQPARLLPAMAMPRLVDHLLAADRGLKVGTLPLLGAADVVEA